MFNRKPADPIKPATGSDTGEWSAPALRKSGWGSILVWLLLGSVIVSVTVIIQDGQRRAAIKVEATRLEDAAREGIRRAMGYLREGKRDLVVANDTELASHLDWLTGLRPDGYPDLCATRLFLLAQAHLLGGTQEDARLATNLFEEGLSHLNRFEGDIWSMGLLGRGRAAYVMGDYAAANADFDVLIQRYPGFGAAYYWRSLSRQGQGDVEGAWDDKIRAR
ncbi:MAG: hypothetical protein LBU79_00645, partial [Planctomycetota bacterium]|nr:hypothetical protein [Planctomycetota bacterium]